MSLPVRSESVVEERPLLELLPDVPDDRRFAFVQSDVYGGTSVVGWGIAARVAVGTGPTRFARARDELRRIAGDEPSHDGWASPIAFLSSTFDPDEDGSVMIIPATVYARRDGVTWRISVGECSTAETPSVKTKSQEEGVDRPRYAGSTIRDEVWLDRVASAIEAIKTGDLEKVVLARDLRLWSRQEFDILQILKNLSRRFPSCFTFLVSHLVGASPELLIRCSGDAIASRVLAGTSARGDNTAEDERLGSSLLASEKDRHEHALAVQSVAESLGPVCRSLEVPRTPALIRLENVQHLGTDISGILAQSKDGTVPHILDLVADLHPTAAVGGSPREPALAAIYALEAMSRDRYSGVVGWCTPDGDGEFAIALRCADIRANRARLFAGAGIVRQSRPEDELTETWLKLRAMVDVLAQ